MAWWAQMESVLKQWAQTAQMQLVLMPLLLKKWVQIQKAQMPSKLMPSVLKEWVQTDPVLKEWVQTAWGRAGSVLKGGADNTQALKR
jgi:hypothetical protein